MLRSAAQHIRRARPGDPQHDVLRAAGDRRNVLQRAVAQPLLRHPLGEAVRGFELLHEGEATTRRSQPSQARSSFLTAGTGSVRCWLLKGGTAMPRTDNDSWEITESVGSTALGVAAARAAETDSENPLIQDPFARAFLDAAGEGMWSLTSDPKLSAALIDLVPDLAAHIQAMVDFMAVRTKWFDDFFLDAVSSGVRQVVILAAGLDSRSWRLSWPAGTTVYELDQAKVLDFKSSTLAQRGAQPTARLVSVAVDLRDDWPTALQAAGFDESVPK